MKHIAWVLLLLFVVAGCSKNPQPLADSQSDDTASGEVVLYSSVDDFLLREVVAAYESQTGVKVRLVGDTEATKTTGLVQRLIAEKAQPRADVWWSSEPFGTIQLQHEGVLEPYTSISAEASIDGGWPPTMRGQAWYGFASRARVIAFDRQRVPNPPQTPLDLVDPQFKGRIGIARPQFGTTRGHFGALLDQWGEEGLRTWLVAMHINGVRLYDGNASAVRAIRQGEIDICLTDTDDVWVAQENGWDIGLAYENEGEGQGTLKSTGSIVMPNTVALVRSGPNPRNGQHLIDFLLSAHVERMMAESDSRNIPLNPSLAAEFESLLVPEATGLDLDRAAAMVPGALDLFQQVFGGD
jgi:iron(III) transport system substrate-binding protein